MLFLALWALAVGFILAPGLRNGSSPFTALATVELLLPLFGIAVLTGQLPGRFAAPGVFVLFIGGLAGLVFRETLYAILAPVPGAAQHLFLAGPIACAVTGVLLVLPLGWRPYMVLPFLPLAGAALAVATRLSDPTLFAPNYLASALALQASALFAIAWPVSRFPHPVLQVGSRIIGSWMLAVALLYGGAYVAGRDKSLTPPPFPPLAGIEQAIEETAPGLGPLPGQGG
ncbi:hypothetical protein [Rhizobium glycinendophyticum]|uniref:Uncharacterized protein n=1 Tax=Rhizobium glycinendophyticum TaxID=2589807 RepID=A0A504UXM8_9HYPH|nr:hypothetical protein [Rhizobium glycinendophyticum]TPP09902.1 hypothetical protein FJQ55_03230 [Rhizobium glycinendophyticum]